MNVDAKIRNDTNIGNKNRPLGPVDEDVAVEIADSGTGGGSTTPDGNFDGNGKWSDVNETIFTGEDSARSCTVPADGEIPIGVDRAAAGMRRRRNGNGNRNGNWRRGSGRDMRNKTS